MRGFGRRLGVGLAPMPDGHHAFLTALLAAINALEQADGLDRFPAWRDAASIARDVPWL